MSLLLLCLVAAATVVVLFLAGVTVYVFSSYLLMLSHTEPKPWGRLLREALVEFCWTVVTQPLLPLYYLVGRSMGGQGGARPIVFVHGYAQNRVGFVGMARALARRGFGPMYGFNYPWFSSIPTNARRLGRFLDRVKRWTNSEQIDLVCHSMGGLVALEYLRTEGSRALVHRCVTIASPHGGVVWQGPIPGACGPELRSGGDYLRQIAGHTIANEVLSIYSTHDNIVHPPASSKLAARGGHDLAIPGGGHLALLFDPQVIDQVSDFLREGRPRRVDPAS